MRGFWRRADRRLDLGSELHASRPEPPAEFVSNLAERVREERFRPWRSGFRSALAGVGSRIAFAGAVTALAVVGAASVGGVGYAGQQGQNLANLVSKAVSPSSNGQQQNTPADDQYRPGCGRGDTNHTHTGPPNDNYSYFPDRCPPNAPPPKSP
jgi:hypothetical protein